MGRFCLECLLRYLAGVFYGIGFVLGLPCFIFWIIGMQLEETEQTMRSRRTNWDMNPDGKG